MICIFRYTQISLCKPSIGECRSVPGMYRYGILERYLLSKNCWYLIEILNKSIFKKKRVRPSSLSFSDYFSKRIWLNANFKLSLSSTETLCEFNLAFEHFLEINLVFFCNTSYFIKKNTMKSLYLGLQKLSHILYAVT